MCKITAPEPETRDGLKFSSTDDKGSIATSPDGRILSNVEREAFTTRDEDRPSADLASFSAGSPPPDIDMRPRGGVKDLMGGFGQGEVNIQRFDNFRDRDDQAKRLTGNFGREFVPTIQSGDRQNVTGINTLFNDPNIDEMYALRQRQMREMYPEDTYGDPDLFGSLRGLVPYFRSDLEEFQTKRNFTDIPDYKRFVNQYNEDDYEMRNDASRFLPVDPRRFNRRSGFLERMASRMTPDYEAAFGEKPISDETDINKRMMMERSDQGVLEAFYNPETKTYTFLDPTQQQATSDVAGPEVQQFAYDSESDTYMSVKPEFPQTGNFGYKVDVDNAMFDLAGDTGIMSLKERGKDLQKGFEAAYGVNVPNDPVKAMQARINDPQYQDFLKAQDSIFAGAANRLGKFMGYDDPFELYKATQAQKERSKQADVMRRRDQDRAMQSQAQQPFDPCPPGYKYDPAQKQCVPVAKEEAETEMGQKFVRNPVAFTGDPNMYGRTGGEYQFFTEVPGLIKAANGIPRGPTGEIRGAGGPKDDLVGPFMLSDQEYVLPKEMVMAAGGGNYDTGIKKLENMRKDSLNKYGDFV